MKDGVPRPFVPEYYLVSGGVFQDFRRQRLQRRHYHDGRDAAGRQVITGLAQQAGDDCLPGLAGYVGHDEVEVVSFNVVVAQAAVDIRIVGAVQPGVLPGVGHGQGVAVDQVRRTVREGLAQRQSQRAVAAAQVEDLLRLVPGRDDAAQQKSGAGVDVMAAEQLLRCPEAQVGAAGAQGHRFVEIDVLIHRLKPALGALRLFFVLGVFSPGDDRVVEDGPVDAPQDKGAMRHAGGDEDHAGFSDEMPLVLQP